MNNIIEQAVRRELNRLIFEGKKDQKPQPKQQPKQQPKKPKMDVAYINNVLYSKDDKGRPKRVNGSILFKNKRGQEEEHWISRSMTVSLYLFCYSQEYNDWCILCNQRGRTSVGKWNTICGYLDYGENLPSAAARECFEETGVKVDPRMLKCMGTNSEPRGGSEDVNTRFVGILQDDISNHVPSAVKDLQGGEQGEVLDIKWIPLSQLDNFPFAFGQNEKIKRQAEVSLPQFTSDTTNEDYKNVLSLLHTMLADNKISSMAYGEISAILQREFYRK